MKIKQFFTQKKSAKNLDLNTENPWLNGKRTWNLHVQGVMATAQIWQVVAIACLLISFSAISGLIYISSQSKFIPLVFQQDSSGNTLSVTRADKVADAVLDDFRTTAFRFIENIRLVTLDVDLQRKAILQTYSYLIPNEAAIIKANEYLNASKEVNPFNRALKETVSIEIHSVLQQSKESWQVDWMETIRNRDGSLKEKPVLMRAIVNLYQNPSKAETSNSEVLINPHFIFVRDFNWSKQLLTKV